MEKEQYSKAMRVIEPVSAATNDPVLARLLSECRGQMEGMERGKAPFTPQKDLRIQGGALNNQAPRGTAGQGTRGGTGTNRGNRGGQSPRGGQNPRGGSDAKRISRKSVLPSIIMRRR